MSTIELGQEFQRSLVKLAVTKAAWLEENRESFQPELFELAQTAQLVTFIVEFYDGNEVAPNADVLKELVKKHAKGEMQKLLMAEYVEVGRQQLDASKIAFITTELRTFAERQNLMRCIADAQMHFQSGDLSGVRSSFDRGLSFGDVSSRSSIMYFEEEAINRRIEYDQQLDKIPTLWRTFDEATRGGPARKELWLFMAPTNRGKSIALVNVAANGLYQGKNVLYVTNEMSAEKVSYRFDRRLTGMTIEEIRNKPKLFKEKLSKFRGLYRGNLNVKEYPARDASVADVANYMKSIARKHNFHTDMLVLDYLDEMKRPKVEKDYIAIGAVTAALHGLTKKANILSWSATQTNRGAFSKEKFDLDDIGDSWEKAKIADGIVGMAQNEEEYEKNLMRFYRLKDRDNKKQVGRPTLMTTDFDHMMIRPLTQEGEQNVKPVGQRAPRLGGGG